MKIGARIKDLRTRQRITLKELAKKAGLTTSFLSQLERGLASPSVGSLEKISEALNTKVGYFFGGEEGKGLIFVKKDRAKRVIGEEKNVFCETLASGLLNIKMQPQVFTIGIGAELRKELIYSEGEKFGMLLEGKVEFLCESEKLILKKDDSLYCDYTQSPQKVRNIGETEARLLWIIFGLV
ncbi:MAG: XRE family transcriptional regulator [Candidatus Omnitrophota bacterium]